MKVSTPKIHAFRLLRGQSFASSSFVEVTPPSPLLLCFVGDRSVRQRATALLLHVVHRAAAASPGPLLEPRCRCWSRLLGVVARAAWPAPLLDPLRCPAFAPEFRPPYSHRCCSFVISRLRLLVWPFAPSIRREPPSATSSLAGAVAPRRSSLHLSLSLGLAIFISRDGGNKKYASVLAPGQHEGLGKPDDHGISSVDDFRDGIYSVSVPLQISIRDGIYANQRRKFSFLICFFVEKVLRTQPNVKRLFLLLRAADTSLAEQRMQTEVLGKDVFKVLREKYGLRSAFEYFISDKLTAVAGDISLKDLGLKDSHIKEQLYDIALGTNTMGAKHVLDFGKKCLKLEMLLHVSTAYVCGEKSGIILEEPFKVEETLNGTSGLNIEEELKLMNKKLNELQAQGLEKTAMEELGLKRARMFGWPNTYVFTKAMGEMVIGKFRENLPIVILRPTIITSTFKEPFPGWIESFRTIDSFCGVYGNGKMTFFLGNPDSILDVVLQMMNAALFALYHPLHDKCNDLNNKINLLLRFVKLFKPYTLFEGIFNNEKLEDLRKTMNQNEAEVFYCDPKCVGWKNYFTNIHIPVDGSCNSCDETCFSSEYFIPLWTNLANDDEKNNESCAIICPAKPAKPAKWLMPASPSIYPMIQGSLAISYVSVELGEGQVMFLSISP
ncbi:hypothetical protein Scep_015278 [Stephania cephalantha]|uniref:Fatty acyl-CoA reductase n=1 Tax=Stephania cephalantha TaxID=152367 RepID=A0AAP0J2K1_9MAGN